MKVVEVIPIVKGITRPTLSYFTKENFKPGSFVKVPIRSGSALGIVLSSTDARKAKAQIKDSSFALKKLSAVEKAGSLGEGFIEAVEKTANFYATTSGAVLSAILPKILLESPELLGQNIKSKNLSEREVKVIALGEKDRFREYRSIVRENFARGKSVLLIAPTADEVMKSLSLLSTGIEQYVFSTANTTPKKLRKLLSQIQEEKHPILFITTPLLAVFRRPDLETIILERENSKAYRILTRPYLHIRKFLENYAKAQGLNLILGDAVLSLETMHREREGRFGEGAPLSWRLKHESSTEVIDMRTRKEFEVISERLKERVRKTLLEGKKVFIFAARKGLSSSTVCGDCGSLLLCKNCLSPLVLHAGKGQNDPPVYACHRCAAIRLSETRCDNCQSWKLVPLGVGVDRVKDEAHKTWKEADIFVVDKDHTPTKAKVDAVLKNFNKSRAGILIGTELALSRLTTMPVVAVASMDSLFSIPDFSVNERIFYLITRLREVASEHFIIQTRNAGKDILDLAAAGNILDFYRMEVKEREELLYPPFGLFIKVSTKDTEIGLKRKAVLLQQLFSQHEPHFIKEKRGIGSTQTLSMILRVKHEDWPEKEILQKLLLLTPDFMVKVDPESIL